jgi:two-component system nitrogen regulation response regulator GlnG
MSRVLVIDDDRSTLLMVRRSLERLNADVLTAQSAEEGLRLAFAEHPDVALLDIVLPRESGLEVARRLHEFDPRLPLVFMTAEAGSETAIEAMQLGAYDYVAKPLDLSKLNELIAKALETRRLMNVPVAVPLDEGDESAGGDVFIGRSPQILEVFKAIGRVARQNMTVLIRGDSGTGKELVARALFQFSQRNDRPFMAVNCAALPETLLESELFGHEKGSFTGAERRRIGKFEQCHGGTLFLDEVGDMSPAVQGKVLRVLQEQRFERVGGNDTIETDVRLIAATNRPLEEMVDRNEFRGDLLYRLNGVTIQLPPLRQRPEDIPLLLRHFLWRARKELDKPEIEGVSPEALELLQQYSWPGNVRELQSVVRRCVLQATGPVIVPDFLPPEIRNGSAVAVAAPAPAPATPAPDAAPRHEPFHHASEHPFECDVARFVDARLAAGSNSLYVEAIELLERYLFTRVLQATDGNQSKAAEVLGITRGKVRDRIAAFNISLAKNVVIDSHAHTTSGAIP